MEHPKDADQIVEWIHNDVKAKVATGLSVADGFLEMVRDYMTALSMWTALKDAFRRATLLNLLHTRRKLFGTRMAEDERAMTYISHARQLTSDLRSMGVEVPEKDVAMTLLTAHPKRFENMIVAIDTLWYDSDMSVELVKSRVI